MLEKKSWKIGMVGIGKVEKLAFGGKGVVHDDHFVIFVSGGIPGQTVRFQIRKKQPNFAEALLIEVLEKSLLEVDSPYEPMPGCTLQNIRYEDQLGIKEAQVYEALEHLGGIHDSGFSQLSILPSPEIIRYRNRVELSFGYARMWSEVGAQGERSFHDEEPCLGFHPPGKWAEVRPITDCFLISEEMNRLKARIEAYALDSELPVWNPKTGRGFWRSVLLREGKRTGEMLISIMISTAKPMSFWEPVIQKLRQGFPQLVHISILINAARGDSLETVEIQKLWGADFLREQIGNCEFTIAPTAFFQTNTLGAETLFAVARDFAALDGEQIIGDLYCGCGTVGLLLASDAKRIIGIELDPAGVEAARVNARKNKIMSAEYHCGAVEKVLPELCASGVQFDVLVVDPPRAGLHPKALKTLLEIPAQRLIYISCNPATLARDLKMLNTGGWRLTKVQPVDMFPHTPHIEVVTKLER